MPTSWWKNALRTTLYAAAAMLVLAGTSFSADVYLAAQSFTKALPGGASVPMWGFALCNANFTTCSAPTSPGPQIEQPAGASLTIHLKNFLPTPVSLVIPGQAGTGNPTWTYDNQGRRRVQSFAAEVAPGASGDYTWNSVRTGTYLYQSGTHPSIQVPMGLFGALLVRPPGTQQVYPGKGYDAEVVLVFSEIDPVQNAAVAQLASGPINPALYPSTINYSPQYFLINGVAFDKNAPGQSTFQAGSPLGLGQWRILLRLLNAGLRSHVPALVGLEMDLLAEDGNVYPSARRQPAVLLPAGKTLDAIATTTLTCIFLDCNTTYPLFDRMLDLTNANQPEGGMLTYLRLGSGSPAPVGSQPVAVDDVYSVIEDTPFSANVLANDGGLTNARLESTPTNGKVTLSSNGAFTYTPNQDFSGKDTFTYIASNGAQDSRVALVTLNVSFANDAPVAGDDGPYTNTIGSAISVAKPGVLGNDQDVDADPLTAVLAGPAPPGLSLNPDGSFTFSGPPGTYTFSYRARDSQNALSNPATVSLQILPVRSLALTVHGPDPLDIVTSYRWLVEEDTTFYSDPNAPVPLPQTLASNFHKSYMPVIAQGCVGSGCSTQVPISQLALDPAKRYFVSVLPNDAGTGAGHGLGGSPIPAGATKVSVLVNRQPSPTAQLSVLVFEDNLPTDGAPSPSEAGLGNFQITLIDTGGRFGISGGVISQDNFGNPLKNYLDCAPPAPENVILTCSDGTALIKNLAPGKYSVTVVPPAGSPYRWSQTTTIEGTRGIDAWLRAGEPPYLVEFGPVGYHVFVGFVSPDRLPPRSGPNTVTGRITNLHIPRLPELTQWDSNSYASLSHTNAWVGLNSAGGLGGVIAVTQAAPDGSFSISNVPNGSYQLVVWDEYLDQIIGFRNLQLPSGNNVGNFPVFNWFGRLEESVFLDLNENGKRDPGEQPIPQQALNLRFRDASIYQSQTTDSKGFTAFNEVFPFFNWLIAEVDYTRFKATGATITVDAGGDVTGVPPPYTGILKPQVQPDGSTTHTDLGGNVLLQGFQVFQGQTNVIEWGKAPYRADENGGIVGIVYYASTRTEEDPRFAVADPWEAGIPRVTVRLYRKITKADGSEGLVLVKEVQTDGWDDSPPTDCPGQDPAEPFVTEVLGGDVTRCYDGLHNFNQVRPGVFDGGYAFGRAAGDPDLPPGKYVVEVVPPPGYELVKEEDYNITIGDVFAPATIVLPNGAVASIMPDQATVAAAVQPPSPDHGIFSPPCVGELHRVPHFLSLFPNDVAPFADSDRPLCNRKEVTVTPGAQANSDFYLFTSTPVAGHMVGLVTDDIGNEVNVKSPLYGEKFGPAFMPIAVRDHLGREISRLYTDTFGYLNGLLPSTFSANAPIPSGYSPAIWQLCVNDPGPIPGPNGTLITDPQYKPVYQNVCYNTQFMPATTTYVDIPTVPTAAFAAGNNPPDCAFPDHTPVIKQVDGDGVGPFLSPGGSRTLWIYARGPTEVDNPGYEGPGSNTPRTITRDYGFGSIPGVVTLGGVPLNVTSWSPDQIVAQVPSGASTGELIVTRGDDDSAHSITSVTVTISNETPIRVTPGGSIQTAIDNAAPGSLILVPPGKYEELVVMWKPVRLQGAGAGSTIINAAKFPSEKRTAWRQKIDDLFANHQVDPLPGQPVGPGRLNTLLGILGTEEGPGITVLAKNNGSFLASPSRIDGFGITRGDVGGGIYVNGWAHGLEISNNDIYNNLGQFHGGIRIGRPFETQTGTGPFGFNTYVNIHHNAIRQNSARGGAGAGLSLCTGTDNYSVQWNFICGNFITGDGAGIGHMGLSNNGLIAHNQILFNQIFEDTESRSGAGLFIGGEPAPNVTGLTLGSGNVTVDANLIQGNQSATGHGGGLRLQRINGQDVAQNQPWFQINITNNIVANNVAGFAGAGIALQDTINSRIVNNTVVNNDSTATVGAVVAPGANTSNAQPSGIASEHHSLELAAVLPAGQPVFSNPVMFNNIIWHNRAFSFDGTGGNARLLPVLTQASVGACPSGANYWDLGVLGEPLSNPSLKLNPTFSILTSTTGYDPSNSAASPTFVSSYCNGSRSLQLNPPTMQVLAALDEGGNFLDVRWGPLVPMGDYHLGANTAAGAETGAPASDYDGEARLAPVDRGADEKTTPFTPSNLVATAALNPARITLTWTDSSSNETSFRIQRALDAGFTNSLVVLTASANSTTLVDSTVTQSTRYYYRVAACNATGCSAYSNVASAIAQPNQPPNGVINSPPGNVTINAGQTVNFTGSGTDPDNNTPLTYLWNFGAGSGVPNSTQQNPGNVQFNTPGTYTVTFTVTDSLGLSDPTPATVQVTVNAIQVNQAPNGIITSPAGNVTVDAGQTVSFAGSGTDPDNNIPLTYLWNFGAGSGVPNSTQQNPGNVQFNNPGTFTVTFTVTDALNLPDPTPATVQVTVNPAGPQASGRIFTTGFEEGDLSKTMWTAEAFAAAVQSSVRHSGNYALQLNQLSP
ncbi:MAG TPA: PKD domain-containing protein, partial [Terriglobales bacterium]|nr:PKD domain-containing protein [Terriglobales bacterium]